MQPHADAEDYNTAEAAADVHPKAPWRVSRVEVLAAYRLHVRFNDGTEGTVEMAELMNSPAAGVFAALRDEKRFKKARVVLGAVTWPGDLDLAPDAMHRMIKEFGTWIIK